jgi:hypothetical protein
MQSSAIEGVKKHDNGWHLKQILGGISWWIVGKYLSLEQIMDGAQVLPLGGGSEGWQVCLLS